MEQSDGKLNANNIKSNRKILKFFILILIQILWNYLNFNLESNFNNGLFNNKKWLDSFKILLQIQEQAALNRHSAL